MQTIRLLMERSAVYRRALAPIMSTAGIMGLLAAAAGLCYHIESPRSFAALWLGTACVAVAAAFVLARRQAFKEAEPFWSPPTYRVAQALLPPLLSGLVMGGFQALPESNATSGIFMTLIWLFFYGCALHSAGFFMVRGIKWFGWIFILGAISLLLFMRLAPAAMVPGAANWIMGLFFGALHFAYGIYLYFTETKTPAA